MEQIPSFFIAAAGGFTLLAAVTIQALVALFATIPLARRHHRENSAFDLKRAYRRVVQVTILVSILTAVITVLVVHFGSTLVIAGYIFGAALALVMSLKRLSPNNEESQKRFEEGYADCFPSAAANPDDIAPVAEPAEKPDAQ